MTEETTYAYSKVVDETEDRLKKHLKECKKRERKAKFEEFKQNVKYGLQQAENWWYYHGDSVIKTVTVAVPTIIAADRFVTKKVEQHDDWKRNRSYYDHSLKKWWRLKRPLTNVQLQEIDSRHQHGERVADILKDMNVLK